MNTVRRDTIAMAIFMHVCAVIYLVMVQYTVINKHEMAWDSSLGELMLTLPLMLVGYAWIMLLIHFKGWDKLLHKNTNTDIPQVMENEGQWKAKAVHYSSNPPK